jgi:hypothetical protein
VIDRDPEDLIARERRAHRLKDQLFSVARPVGLGVLDAMRELAHVGEMRLARVVERAFRGVGSAARATRPRRAPERRRAAEGEDIGVRMDAPFQTNFMAGAASSLP